MNLKPNGKQGPGDPTAARAALGLGLLAVGGWLLTTARPWDKPGHPLTLALGWTASGAMLVCGLLLLARCVRTVHAEADRDGEPPPGPPGPSDSRLRPSGPPSRGR
ncbi:hypothetical protein ACTVZO_24530 [Streptomyces sp. IBSNAI002]|uniref:hypothetical protein n=1 Tax=Streptomyces sp. IBSNAI002 TaxID=3457500 RepID=UPI003FD3510F